MNSPGGIRTKFHGCGRLPAAAVPLRRGTRRTAGSQERKLQSIFSAVRCEPFHRAIRQPRAHQRMPLDARFIVVADTPWENAPQPVDFFRREFDLVVRRIHRLELAYSDIVGQRHPGDEIGILRGTGSVCRILPAE